jgi:myosin heavy subunit
LVKHGIVALVVTLLIAAVAAVFAGFKGIEASEAEQKQIEAERKESEAKQRAENADNRSRIAQSRNEELEEQNRNLRTDNDAVQEDLKNSKQELENSREERTQIRQQLSTQQQALASTQARLVTAQQESEQARQQVNDLTAERKRLEEEIEEIRKEREDSQEFVDLSGTLAELIRSLDDDIAVDLLSQVWGAAQVLDEDPDLTMAVLHSAIAFAWQHQGEGDSNENLNKAREYLDQTKEKLESRRSNPDENYTQLEFLYLKAEANYLWEREQKDKALTTYEEAFKIIEVEPYPVPYEEEYVRPDEDKSLPFRDLPNRIVSKQNVEAFHREYIRVMRGRGRAK